MAGVGGPCTLEPFPYVEARGGDEKAVESWVRLGGNISEAFPAEEWSPLHLAAAQGDVRLVRLLLDSGAQVSARVSTKVLAGHSPLHIASRFGHCDVVALLVERGADVEACDTHGFTPLHYAAGNGHADCIDMLQAAGAMPTAQASGGATALDMAEHMGFGEAVVHLKRAHKSAGGKAAVKAWLEAMDCEEYAPRFFQAGYDDLGFIAAHGLTAEDVDCIGVPLARLGLRRKLLALHGVTDILEQGRDMQEGSSAEEGSDSGSEGDSSGSGSESTGQSSDSDSDSGSGDED